MLDELFPRREAAKRAGDDVAAHAIKILMNSFYGVLGTSACRFHNPALANAITGQGREVLLWSKRWFEQPVSRSSMATPTVCSSTPATIRLRRERKGAQLAAALNGELARYIDERWHVSSRLELKFEKMYLKLFLPRVRHGTAGARKRYAGLVDGDDGDADRIRRHGSGAPRLDGARQAGAT